MIQYWGTGTIATWFSKGKEKKKKEGERIQVSK